jgi:LPXTG-motif cell wall-anchored protein
MTAAPAAATQGDDHKQSVCHPVEGEGETGTGWNIIPPDKASSHIDEETGEGFHTRKDGRTDVYAVDGKCPGDDTTTTTTTTTTVPVTTVPETTVATTTPPTVPPVAPTEPPKATEIVPAPEVTPAPTEPPQALPATGVNNWWLAALATVMLLAGGAVLRVARR